VSWILVGGVCGFLGVALGAFGAHALRRSLSAEQLAWWTTATHHLLIHALALVGVGLLQRAELRAGPAGWAFLAGMLLFSGTLFAMALGAPRWLGAITPLGGLGLLAGWALLAWSGRA
jgi:uncharacterized membrane protein YgdD (TMEM256/DUF423 family)